ncbi:hypothetical protein EJD97_003319 [Solanum chilense]|uniref:Uncharacterized protein n=1 Tax=Solanum chilense TaxID=4083 RepID=A0A6N2BVI8_SOLCI|nr:hypothetical protein EJD97_003319 [Solanum chilense]
MGRRGHDGPSWPQSSYTLQILLPLSSLPSTNRSDFPIFLQQLHYDVTYGPSQARRTVIGPVGGNFSAFLA